MFFFREDGVIGLETVLRKRGFIAVRSYQLVLFELVIVDWELVDVPLTLNVWFDLVSLHS